MRYQYNVLQSKKDQGVVTRRSSSESSRKSSVWSSEDGSANVVATSSLSVGLSVAECIRIETSASRKSLVSDAEKRIEEDDHEQDNLPLSPPRSPPFSPTDNNQDKTLEEDLMRYPAGNWTYGERKEREETSFPSGLEGSVSA